MTKEEEATASTTSYKEERNTEARPETMAHKLTLEHKEMQTHKASAKDTGQAHTAAATGLSEVSASTGYGKT